MVLWKLLLKNKYQNKHFWYVNTCQGGLRICQSFSFSVFIDQLSVMQALWCCKPLMKTNPNKIILSGNFVIQNENQRFKMLKIFMFRLHLHYICKWSWNLKTFKLHFNVFHFVSFMLYHKISRMILFGFVFISYFIKLSVGNGFM